MSATALALPREAADASMMLPADALELLARAVNGKVGTTDVCHFFGISRQAAKAKIDRYLTRAVPIWRTMASTPIYDVEKAQRQQRDLAPKCDAAGTWLEIPVLQRMGHNHRCDVNAIIRMRYPWWRPEAAFAGVTP